MSSIYARAYELSTSDKLTKAESKDTCAKDLIEALLVKQDADTNLTSEDLTKIVVKLAGMMKD